MKSKMKSGLKALIGKRNSVMLKKFISDSNCKGVKVKTTSILVGTNVDISQRTLTNCLFKHEFKYKEGAQKLKLSATHRKIRVEVISTWIHGGFQR